MDELFESAWLKWAWATGEAKALRDEIEAFRVRTKAQGLTLRTSTEYDPKRHCVIARVEEIERLPPFWNLQLGGIVHNYRSCLDHVAWALVTRGHRPPSTLKPNQINNVYFPICGERADFNAQIDVLAKPRPRPKLPGVRRADLAIVRRFQPYVRGRIRAKPRYALTILDQISKDDKHRTIQPVLSSPTFMLCHLGEPRDCTITKEPTQARRNPLEVGAEIARVYVKKTGPKPDVDMECVLAAEPMLQQNVWLDDWLAKTKACVFGLLVQFCQPPPVILELGIDPNTFLPG